MIAVAPLHELESAIERWRPSHVISLASPGATTAVLPSDIEILRLSFHDVVEPREGLTMASKTDVERLLVFAQDWSGDRPLLIHCWAGVSRSPAAAYAIACSRAEEGRETGFARRLREVAPFATPNRHLVALADQRLERGGAMSAAIADIGRGAEISMGHTFIL